MSKCKYCQSEIEWATVRGRPYPVEPDEVEYNDVDAGEYLVTAGGNVYQVQDDVSLPNVKGRLSHLNRCGKQSWKRKTELGEI